MSSSGIMPLSGVRISWLIVARNSAFAIIALSASCLARISSLCTLRSFSSSACIATCVAEVCDGCGLTATGAAIGADAGSGSTAAYARQPIQPPSAASTSGGAIHNASIGGSTNGAPRPIAATTNRLTRTIHGAAGCSRANAESRRSGRGGIEVEAQFLSRLLHEVPLQIIHACVPQQRCALGVFDARRDHAAVAVVRAHDDLAQFLAQYGVAQPGAGVFRGEFQIRHRQVLQQLQRGCVG